MVSDTRVSPLLNRLGGLYRDPNRVDRDSSSLLKSSVGQHLSPAIASLVENNGDSSQTLCLKGTISIHFKGQEYQQLVDIYLPPGYPVRPPVNYVRLATPNMYLKENHAHVGTDGQVYLPYLHEWRPHSHTLIELVVAMSSVFSADPPVFTRSTPAPPPPPPTYSSYTSTAASSCSSAAGNASFATANNASYSQADADAQEKMALEASAKEAAEREEKEREEKRQRQATAAQEEWDAKNFASTKEKVRRKMYTSLVQDSTALQERIQQDMMDAQKLTLSNERFTSQWKDLTNKKKELEEQHVAMDKALIDIQEFCKNAQEAQEEQKEVDVDDLVQPTSVLDAQMMDLSCKAASYTDVLYFLDKALHNHVIELPQHLKQVRQISKQQFLTKALLLKVAQTRGMNASRTTGMEF